MVSEIINKLHKEIGELKQQNEVLMVENASLKELNDKYAQKVEVSAAKNEFLSSENHRLEKECCTMRAQLDMVHLIFGRNH